MVELRARPSSQVAVKETVSAEDQQAARRAASEHADKARRDSCALDDALSAPDAPPPSARDVLARAGHACMQVTAIRHTVKVRPLLTARMFLRRFGRRFAHRRDYVPGWCAPQSDGPALWPLAELRTAAFSTGIPRKAAVEC